ncbi:transketolase family protein, partial [Psychrilyobacter piezotolerans]
PTLIKKLGIYDQFGQSGTGDQLLDEYGLRAKDIVAKVKENM